MLSTSDQFTFSFIPLRHQANKSNAETAYNLIFICANAVCPKKADIVFLLDESTSIVAAAGAYDNWNVYILGFVAQVIASFPISQDLTRIGLVKFSSSNDPNGRICLNQYNNSIDLESAVSAEKLKGKTDLADGIRMACDVMFSASNGTRGWAFLIS